MDFLDKILNLLKPKKTSIFIYFIITIFVTLSVSSVAWSQSKPSIFNNKNGYLFCFNELYSSSNLCLENFFLNIEKVNLEADSELNIKLFFLPIRMKKKNKKEMIFRIYDKKINIEKITVEPENIKFPEDHYNVIEFKNIPYNSLPDSINNPNVKNYFNSFINNTIKKYSNKPGNPPKDVQIAQKDYKRFINESEKAIPVTIVFDINNILIEESSRIIEKLEIGLNKKFKLFEKKINREFYLFPFNEYSIEIPIGFRFAQGLLSDFEFEEPKDYRDSIIEIEGIDAKINIRQGHKQGLVTPPPFPIVYSGQDFLIKAQLRRTDFSTYPKLGWIIPTAFLCGGLLRFCIIKLNDILTAPQLFQKLLNGVIYFVSTILLPFYWVIHTNNSEIDSFFESGNLSIFDVFIFVGFIFFILTFTLVAFLARNPIQKIIAIGVSITLSLLALINNYFINSLISIVVFIVLVLSIIVLPFINKLTIRDRITLILSFIFIIASTITFSLTDLSNLEQLANNSRYTLSAMFDFVRIIVTPPGQ